MKRLFEHPLHFLITQSRKHKGKRFSNCHRYLWFLVDHVKNELLDVLLREQEIPSVDCTPLCQDQDRFVTLISLFGCILDIFIKDFCCRFHELFHACCCDNVVWIDVRGHKAVELRLFRNVKFL